MFGLHFLSGIIFIIGSNDFRSQSLFCQQHILWGNEGAGEEGYPFEEKLAFV